MGKREKEKGKGKRMGMQGEGKECKAVLARSRCPNHSNL